MEKYLVVRAEGSEAKLRLSRRKQQKGGMMRQAYCWQLTTQPRMPGPLAETPLQALDNWVDKHGAALEVCTREELLRVLAVLKEEFAARGHDGEELEEPAAEDKKDGEEAVTVAGGDPIPGMPQWTKYLVAMTQVEPIARVDAKVPCLQEIPAEVHGLLSTALKELFEVVAYCWATDHPRKLEAEKLLHLFPRMIFPRPPPVDGGR